MISRFKGDGFRPDTDADSTWGTAEDPKLKLVERILHAIPYEYVIELDGFSAQIVCEPKDGEWEIQLIISGGACFSLRTKSPSDVLAVRLAFRFGYVDTNFAAFLLGSDTKRGFAAIYNRWNENTQALASQYDLDLNSLAIVKPEKTGYFLAKEYNKNSTTELRIRFFLEALRLLEVSSTAQIYGDGKVNITFEDINKALVFHPLQLRQALSFDAKTILATISKDGVREARCLLTPLQVEMLQLYSRLFMLEQYRNLQRITVREFSHALLEAGVVKKSLVTRGSVRPVSNGDPYDYPKIIQVIKAIVKNMNETGYNMLELILVDGDSGSARITNIFAPPLEA